MIQATPEEIRKLTEQVLARPEFLEQSTWTQILIDNIGKWLRQVAQWSASHPDLSQVLMIVLGVVLVLLIGHIVYTVVREVALLRKPAAAAPHQHSLRALEGVAESWTDAFRLARLAMDAGDLYRALWITHRVLLSVLDRMGQIKFVRWKTNTDYLRECRDGAGVTATLAEVTAAYECVIYAHTDIDRAQAARLLAQVESLAAGASR